MMTCEPEDGSIPDLAADLESYRRRRRAQFYPKTDAPLPDDLLRTLRTIPRTVDLDGLRVACRSTLGVDALTAEPLERQGTFHALHRLRLADGRAVIARVNVLSPFERDWALHVDRWASDRLRAEDLPAPRVLAVDVSRRFVPFDFELLEEAPGESLAAFDHDEGAIRPLLRSLGRTLARVHRIGTAGFGWFDAGPTIVPDGGDPPGMFANWRDYVLLNLDDHIRVCENIGAIDADESRLISSAFVRWGGLLDGVEPSLLHGDPGNHNVFVRDGTISALIDWEDSLSGDPAFDIAFWGTFHPDGRLGAFLEGYRAERPLPDDFERRYWLYSLRVALSKTVHRHRFGYRDRPGRAPASGRIRKALERITCACS